MNYSDLFVVLLLAAGLYGLIVALARQPQFVTRAVNPYRVPWLLAGLTCLWFGIGLLRLEAHTWDMHAMGNVLASLVTDAPLSTRGKVSAVAILLGLLFVVLVIWCRFNYPKDPIVFRRPEQRGAALRYYVTKLKGGLEYAVLMRPGGERLEEAWEPRHMRTCLPHLPRVNGQIERVERSVDDQIAFWRQTAEHMHQSIQALDAAIAPAHQGTNRRMVFDCEYGGLFFAYLRPPVPGNAECEPIYVFAATVSQEAVNMKLADAHFDLLMRALKGIDASVRLA
ncbi:MAG TPA: hypothetical protein VHR66_19490 [Gemmataceae bacterium]|jgi:hypothetical protein|nr:hypothetical protein [Gemmataceae bacterium]